MTLLGKGTILILYVAVPIFAIYHIKWLYGFGPKNVEKYVLWLGLDGIPFVTLFESKTTVTWHCLSN